MSHYAAFYGNWMQLVDFPPFVTGKTTFVTSSLISAYLVPSEKLVGLEFNSLVNTI